MLQHINDLDPACEDLSSIHFRIYPDPWQIPCISLTWEEGASGQRRFAPTAPTLSTSLWLQRDGGAVWSWIMALGQLAPCNQTGRELHAVWVRTTNKGLQAPLQCNIVASVDANTRAQRIIHITNLTPVEVINPRQKLLQEKP